MGTLQILDEYKRTLYIAIALLLIGVSSAGRIKRQNEEIEATTTFSTDANSTDEEIDLSFLPLTCGVKDLILNRIVGGEEAIKGSWPWMAVLFRRSPDGSVNFQCGGSLVTNRHVLTAGHCVYRYSRQTNYPPQYFIVRLGAYNLTNALECEYTDAEVEEVRNHESFKPEPLTNDIAVLKLKKPVIFNENISPVCLPFGSIAEEDLYRKPAIVLGYGMTHINEPLTEILREATVIIRNQVLCVTAYAHRLEINNTYLCAGMPDGSRDACWSDSGGPLMILGQDGNYYLIGIVSDGEVCGSSQYPGLYTRVTEYLGWLSTKLNDSQ